MFAVSSAKHRSGSGTLPESRNGRRRPSWPRGTANRHRQVAKTNGASAYRSQNFGDHAARGPRQSKDGKLVEETVWFDDLPVAVLKPKGASATSPVSGTGNVATNNQDANNTGTNGNTAPPAAPSAKVNVEVFYVHPDHLGTPRVITASTALAATTGTGITSPQTVNKAVWRWDSDPFGSNATANSAPNENPNTLSQVVGTATLPYLFGFDLAFPGQKRDRETGKHYNYFRDYDPAVGRYFESDPIGLDGGVSTFAYVASQPIQGTDVFGLDYWIEGAAATEQKCPEQGCGLHQSVCVGKPYGKRFCISFGRKPGQGWCFRDCKGHVYQDRSSVGPIEPDSYRYTDPKTDAAIEAYLRGLLGNEDRYDFFSLSSNCRGFSAGTFAKLEAKYHGRPGTPPAPPGAKK